MTKAFRVVIGLGSNVGDSIATLRSAAAAIDRVAPIRARSWLYRTKPVGGVAQPDFVNAAVLAEYTQSRPGFDLVPSAHMLLDELQRIEAAHGRDRAKEVRWGPRTLDLDILWIEGLTIADERLVVPHPRLRERAFAMLPLRDVLADVPVEASATEEHVTRPGERL